MAARPVDPDAAADQPADAPLDRPADNPADHPVDHPVDTARWRRIRRRWVAGYVVALVVVVLVAGVPTDRGSLLLIVVSGLGITCLGRGWPAFRRVLLDWLPFTAALIAYDYSRGLSRRVGAPLHMADIAGIDRSVFGAVPSVVLQRRFLDAGTVHWYDAAATLVYTSHFVATPVLAAVLWLRNREAWLAFVRRVIALAVAGLVTYVVFPAAPPWYASKEHVIGPVIRASSRGWAWLHVNHAGNLLQEGQVASNPVAAMPSLHTAYATIITLFVLSRFRSRWRLVVLAYPAVMALALVYLGEHYVVDVAAGIVYAVLVDRAVRWWENRHCDRVDVHSTQALMPERTS